MSGLGRTVVGVGVGFIAAQASIAGVSRLFSSTIGAAAAFEHQLAQIRGLTGATTEDTDLLSGAIKDMARTMPKSPAELGAGAYFILSAGITDASEAADVLEISAKASAAGLGETRVVADAVTSALNAYKLEAGEAGRITDILTTTVRLGKTEAAALAGSIGRILPVAAAMGVSFEEVGANLAVMTKVGLSADEAATSLRATLTAMLRPTTEAEEALAGLGLSSEGLREQIREKGLLSTLSTLMEKTGGNTEQITKIIPNVRALTNVLGTVGSQAETYAETLDEMNRAQGATKAAFAEVADTAQFKMGVAMQQLNVALLELGEEVLPLVADAATGFAAIISTLVGGVGALGDAIETPTKAINALTESSEGGILVQGKFKDAVKALAEEQRSLRETTDEERKAQKAATEETRRFDAELRRLAESTGINIDLLMRAGLTIDELKETFASAGVSIGLTAGEIQSEIDLMRARAADLAGEMESNVAPTTVRSLEDIEGAADNARSALTNMFRETTAEEAAAGAALADLKFEAGQLEAKTGDLTAAELARLAQLNDELIPAQRDNLDLLRLEKEAVEKHALAQDQALIPMEAWRSIAEGQGDQIERLSGLLNALPDQVVVNVIQQLTTQGQPVEGAFVPMQHGGIVTRPTLALLAETKPEAVIPLDRIGGAASTPQPVGIGGGNVVVNFHGPVFGIIDLERKIEEIVRNAQLGGGFHGVLGEIA